MSKSVELQLHYVHDTPDAWLVSPTGEEKDNVWLPKKFVDRGERRRGKQGNVYDFTLPTWLAEKEGLV
jgi:hypothetical protein